MRLRLGASGARNIVRARRHDLALLCGPSTSPLDGLRMPRRALLVWTLLWTLLPGASAGCSVGQADSRIAYWQAETRAHVPVGSRIDDARAFLAARGLDLHCCMSGPQIEHAYSATERNIGRFGWIEYSALIVVDVSPDQRVSQVRVLRIGAGL